MRRPGRQEIDGYGVFSRRLGGSGVRGGRRRAIWRWGRAGPRGKGRARESHAGNRAELRARGNRVPTPPAASTSHGRGFRAREGNREGKREGGRPPVPGILSGGALL